MYKLYPKDVLRDWLSSAEAEGRKNLKAYFQTPARQIETLLDEIREEADRLSEPGCAVTEDNTDRARKLLTRLYTVYRQALRGLCAHSSLPRTKGGVIADRDIEEIERIELDEKVDDVRLYFEDRRIMVRTPLVPNKRNPSVTVVVEGRGSVFIENTKLYGEVVRRAFKSRPDLFSVDMSVYQKKTLFYLFVFTDKRSYVDNDNRETEAITNQICAFLPGGDGPEFCRFVLDAAITAEIPAGTYVTVLPRGDRLPEVAEVVAYWQSKYAGEYSVFS